MTVIQPADKGHLRKLRKLVRLLPTPRYRRALRHGVAAAVEHSDVAFGHRFQTVIDVGGHKGQFAVFAREHFSEARLICVEPLSEERHILERVVEGAVTVHPVAAGATSGELQMHVSRASDSSSLLPITDNYTSAWPGTEEARMVSVKVEPLDTLVPVSSVERPALLKIDVQGGEGAVLEGAQRLLGVVDEVYVECSFVEFYAGQILADDVIERLRASGFRLTGVYGVAQDLNGRTLQADLLFSREVVRAPGRA